jgi:trans-aconitate 2-methyltransferase
MDSASFYDQYLDQQVRSGINERVIGLYQRLEKAGLKNSSHVLELGCGIGTLSSLIAKKITAGSLEAVDISPKSIDFAKQHVKGNSCQFICADITSFEPNRPSYGFILLFDTLEHLLPEKHANFFQSISRWMCDGSQLLINIPNPGYILYDRKNNAPTLQEIDEPVYLNKLINDIDASGLEMISMETYSVWAREDYQYFVVRKKREFAEELLSKHRSFGSKLRNYISRRWRRIIYRYP